MDTKNVFYGGTFSSNPLSMYAAKLILETIINKKHIKEQIEAIKQELDFSLA